MIALTLSRSHIMINAILLTTSSKQKFLHWMGAQEVT